MVHFLTKYEYLCKHPYHATVGYTDHKSLTYFVLSDLHEDIYGHWADQLRRLNIRIKYDNPIVPPPAKVLSKTQGQKPKVRPALDGPKPRNQKPGNNKPKATKRKTLLTHDDDGDMVIKGPFLDLADDVPVTTRKRVKRTTNNKCPIHNT